MSLSFALNVQRRPPTAVDDFDQTRDKRGTSLFHLMFCPFPKFPMSVLMGLILAFGGFVLMFFVFNLISD